MFICRDLSQEFLVSAYWEDAELVIVAKKVLDDGQLEQQCAVRYERNELPLIVNLLDSNDFCCGDICLDTHANAGLANFISAGRKRHRRTDLRVTPEMRN